MTKWSVDCDKALGWLICLDIKLKAFIGDPFSKCKLWCFADADHAGEYDNRSTTGCFLTVVGPNTYFPLTAFSKKQTSVSMSSTESEVVMTGDGLDFKHDHWRNAGHHPCCSPGRARPTFGSMVRTRWITRWKLRSSEKPSPIGNSSEWKGWGTIWCRCFLPRDLKEFLLRIIKQPLKSWKIANCPPSVIPTRLNGSTCRG